MKRILALFIFIVAILPPKVIAGGGSKDSALHTKVAQWMNHTGGLRFLENKGQMMDMQRKPINNVLYKTGSGGMDIYVTTSGLSYVFTKYNKYKKKGSTPVIDKRHQRDSVTINYCRADMNLVGASIKKENIIQEGESTNRTDYYYGDICPNGILGVHSYEKITIKDIYPGIDWVLQGGKQGLKYNFIVHPGADPSLIKLKYKWTDKPQLQDDGTIEISTPMGNIIEGNPVSYCNGEQVQTAYIIKDSEIHFNVGNYNSTQTLIIDPTLVWATYYSGYNESDDLTCMQDDGTNIWLTGSTISAYFPTLNPGNGAYFQGTLSGYPNVFILQFSTAGVLKWATYYGGSTHDNPWSIYSDGVNVWITGSTSSPDFPIYNPGGGAYYQSHFGGVAPAFILQFSTAGVRKWATYYGGNGNDVGISIQSDGSNVWVTGYTDSPNFPLYNPGGGAYYQGTLGTPAGNAFILQFDITGVRKWATYYGGSVVNTFGDEGTSICSDTHNVWVTGITYTEDFPTLNPGGGAYYQGTLLSPISNAFILQFNMGGVRKWATYYGGSGSNGYTGDEGNSINTDGKHVWVTGLTVSPDFPTLNPGGGTYFQGTLLSTKGNVFVLKFDTTGVRKWATYYGGSGNNLSGDNGTSIKSDGKSVWVCGSAVSPDFPTFNPGCGFYQDTIGRNSTPRPSDDIFILQFDTGGIRKWATYYGTDLENDYSYACSDGTDVFVAGDASYKGYPTINPGGGAYYCDTVNISDTSQYGINEYVIIGKFIINSGNLSVSPNISICRGDSTMLSASGDVSYSWSPPTGLSAVNIPDPYAKPLVTTTYTITAIDTGLCAGTRTDSVKVTVDTVPGVVISKDTSICKGSSVTLHTTGNYSYNWSTGATTSSISIVGDTATRTYTVSIRNGACVKDTAVTVTVVPLPTPVITGTPLKCQGAIDTLMVSSSVNPTTYQWENGSTSTSIITGNITSDTTIYVTAYNKLGCPVKDSFKVDVKLPPAVTVNPPTVACSGSEVLLKADAAGGGPFTYMWSPGGKTTDTITVNPDSVTLYSVVVSNGCITTKTTIVIPDNPTLSACCDHIIFAGDDTVLVAKSSTAKTYQWSPQVNCLNPLCDSVQVSPTVTTTYTVTMTDSAGCQLERVVTIVVENACPGLIIPNVFTPDYAGPVGLNNVFYIKTSPLDAWSIIIYDRWGKEMFQSINPNQYWDGNTESGDKAPDGVYYYIINATCENTSYKKDGFLQLIR